MPSNKITAHNAGWPSQFRFAGNVFWSGVCEFWRHDHTMKSRASSFLAARLIAASIVCLLILAIAVPSLGSVSLPNHKIGYGWRDALSVAIILAPLVVILIGAACSKIAETVGWVLLFAVVALCIYEMATI